MSIERFYVLVVPAPRNVDIVHYGRLIYIPACFNDFQKFAFSSNIRNELATKARTQ